MNRQREQVPVRRQADQHHRQQRRARQVEAGRRDAHGEALRFVVAPGRRQGRQVGDGQPRGRQSPGVEHALHRTAVHLDEGGAQRPRAAARSPAGCAASAGRRAGLRAGRSGRRCRTGCPVAGGPGTRASPARRRAADRRLAAPAARVPGPPDRRSPAPPGRGRRDRPRWAPRTAAPSGSSTRSCSRMRDSSCVPSSECPPSSKKSSCDADARDAEHALEQRGELAFQGIARREVGSGEVRPVVRPLPRAAPRRRPARAASQRAGDARSLPGSATNRDRDPRQRRSRQDAAKRLHRLGRRHALLRSWRRRGASRRHARRSVQALAPPVRSAQPRRLATDRPRGVDPLERELLHPHALAARLVEDGDVENQGLGRRAPGARRRRQRRPAPAAAAPAGHGCRTGAATGRRPGCRLYDRGR